MPLQSVQAIAHPDGNRIDLAWQVEPEAVIDGVRIVRSEGRYPQHPEDGVIVADVSTANQTSDLNLAAEQVYYYRLFPYIGDPPVYEYDAKNQASSLATAPNGYAATMLRLLPAIYHRYDKDTQFLARFLQISGGQLDQFHSLASFSRQLRHLEKTPGPMLPLLAQWIAWKTDYKRDLNNQRDEIKNAPAIYRRTGLLPTLEATVKRISNWESRSKEYVDNVFASNRPPRLNLWSLARDSSGVWSNAEVLQSLDYCYEGRPAYALDANGTRWLFYHTQRKGHWEIWSKSTPSIILNLNLLGELVDGPISATLWQALTDAGFPLAQTSLLSNIDTRIWEILDGTQRYLIERTDAHLKVYDQAGDTMVFGGSQVQIVNDYINKYPSAVTQGDVLWLFWTTYHEVSGQWRIALRRRQNSLWSNSGPESGDDTTVNPFIDAGSYDATRQRRRAFAVSDGSDRVWLFWQEFINGRWQLRYNLHNGGNWGEPVTFPLDGGDDPRVEDDLMAVITPSAPDPRIVLLWARQGDTVTANGRRWQISMRVKSDQVLDAANWSAVQTLPKDAGNDDYHDREPFALLNNSDELEVFFASNREDSGWSVWRSTLLDFAAGSWSAAERITEAVYQQRAPLPVLFDDALGLFYRSNRKRIYNSEVYRSTETHDERYGGSFTADARHYQLIRLRDKFEDPQRYTYDAGVNGVRDDSNRIARDTVGAFINTDTMSDQEVQNGIARLRRVVKEFMPMTDRAVFITEKTTHSDYVYDYARPAVADPVYINSYFLDDWSSVAEESALAPDEDFSAVLES